MTVKDVFETEGLLTDLAVPPSWPTTSPTTDADGGGPAEGGRGDRLRQDQPAALRRPTSRPSTAVFGTTNNPWDTSRTTGRVIRRVGRRPRRRPHPPGARQRHRWLHPQPLPQCGTVGHKPSFGVVPHRTATCPAPPGSLGTVDMNVVRADGPDGRGPHPRLRRAWPAPASLTAPAGASTSRRPAPLSSASWRRGLAGGARPAGRSRRRRGALGRGRRASQWQASPSTGPPDPRSTSTRPSDLFVQLLYTVMSADVDARHLGARPRPWPTPRRPTTSPSCSGPGGPPPYATRTGSRHDEARQHPAGRLGRVVHDASTSCSVPCSQLPPSPTRSTTTRSACSTARWRSVTATWPTAS